MFSARRHGGALAAAVVLAFAVHPAMAGEEGPSDVGVSMAATLMGSISFIMLLYYFINYDDKDIKQKAWETISSTISIFIAVLLFSSFNDLTEAYIISPIFGEGDATMGALLIDIIHMLFWFVMMQLSLARMSGAAGPNAVDQAWFEKLSEEEQEEVKEEKECNMACFAVLLAHITGFASINAFGTVQAVFFSSSPAKAFIAVPVAFICLIILQRITDHIRERVSMGDGEKNEFEKLWDEETEEAENDVMGLTLSFTFINALRFLYTDCLPNQEGKEEECAVSEYLFNHTFQQKASFMVTGLVFTGLIFLIRNFWPDWAEEEWIEENVPKENKRRHNAKIIARMCDGLFVSVGMCFCWLFFYGTQMILAGWSTMFRGEAELLSVCLALLLSVICFGGLIPLDWLADQDWTDAKCDRAIRAVMDAMALLIGFSWEQCFDTSVDALAERTKGGDAINPHTTKLFLSIFCASLVGFAWKWYMLPFIVSKGWRYGYAFKLEDIEKMTMKMVQENESDSEDENATPPVSEKKLQKVIKMLNNIHSHGSERTAGGGGGKSGPGDMGAVGGYKALPADDAQALKAKNDALVAELSKAKSASQKAQQMLDTTMESMLASMKHMNQTVSRIESSA